MSGLQWAFALYFALGAAFAGHCMVEVETEDRRASRPGKGTWRWWIACIGAAMVVATIWLGIVVWALMERDRNG